MPKSFKPKLKGGSQVDRCDCMVSAAAGAAAACAGAADAAPKKFPFPIIDTQVHLDDPTRPKGVPWPSPEQPKSTYRRFLPADYRKIAEPYGVVGLIETECSPWLEDNYWVLDVAAPEPIVVGEVGDLL